MRKLFKKTIASENPTLVYFFASWCVPCKLMRPTVEKIVEEGATAINSLEIDVELEKAIVKNIKLRVYLPWCCSRTVYPCGGIQVLCPLRILDWQ